MITEFLRERVTMIKKLKSQRGQTIVEFAFILPLLVLILIGIIDYSIFLYDRVVVTNASREGARRASLFLVDPNLWQFVPLDSAAIGNIVNNYLAARVVTFGNPTLAVTTNAYWYGGSPLPTGSFTWDNSPPMNATDPPTYKSEATIKVEVTYTYTYLALPRIIGWSGTTDIKAVTIMRTE